MRRLPYVVRKRGGGAPADTVDLELAAAQIWGIRRANDRALTVR
jgi:hypothetical protein